MLPLVGALVALLGPTVKCDAVWEVWVECLVVSWLSVLGLQNPRVDFHICGCHLEY